VALVAAITLAVLFGLGSLPAAGAAPNGKIVLSGQPPYTGGLKFAHNWVTTVGCASGASYSLPHRPTFSIHTGLAQFDLGVQMFPCAAPGSPSTGAIHYLNDGVRNLNFTAAQNGSYLIKTNWTVKGSFDYNVSYNNSTPNGSIDAYFWMGHSVCVIDLTSPGPRNCAGWNVDSFGANNGTGVFNISWVSYTTSGAKLIAGHHYELESFLTCHVEILDFYGVHTGTANAQLNFASAGYGGTLDSYRVAK
jgi:hypothetical protein